jgi:predicted small metal-binding protein
VSKEVVCPPCGEVLRGENDDELVTVVVNHARGHGHDVSEVDREQILSTAYEV